MDLNKFLADHPELASLLDFLDDYGGMIFASVFFLFIGYIFYWVFVVLRKRVRELFAELVRRGYSDLVYSNPEASEALRELAPIYVHTPRTDSPIPDWDIRHACCMATADMTRYVMDVTRTQVDRPDVSQNTTMRDSTVILEERHLPFAEEIHLAPTRDARFVEWEERFKLREVKEGVKPEFLDCCKMFTASGAVDEFSESLQEALLEASQYFAKRSFRVSFKFGRRGWGICTGMRIYKLADMEALLEIVNKISAAV